MSFNPRLRNWQGRHVWLIGAGHGIGAALAHQLRAAGALLALSGRNEAALRAVAADDAHCLVLPLDVTREQDWLQARGQLLQRWPHIDLVVMLAGDYAAVRAWQLTPELARHMVEVNLLGVMYGTAAVVPALLHQQHGSIALVASAAGWVGMPNGLVYGATKAAVNHFAQTLYLDLRPRGIGVHVVNPGFVATRLTARNDFAMPALISAEQAASAILAGLARGDFDIHFPRRFSLLLKLAAHLPYRLYFWLAHRVTGL
ncbi:SDR family oxidoreductase [Vogesella sp. LIG4]|uniref:SDR family NAD(P)-dependent oxidoreductase n=1 Tax=Vogesella sp. LIG4 TaxID=1192162 RepID=UPI00081FE692|nr:SDR family NAD(P)-dependent oxidoreductase [Vogesella sp. LIG4]SCK26056.1 Short-chain dehydrogenase [Vogesella sp. LIG4]